MAEVFQKNGRAHVAGTEVLRWRISLPLGEEKIASFYTQIGERVQSFCEGALRERAESEFEASSDPNKRFYFPVFSYSLEGIVTFEDEAFFSVLLSASLRRRGEKAPFASWEEGQIWEKKGAWMLPPEEAISHFCGERLSRKERKAARVALLFPEEVRWYDGESWYSKKRQ